MSSYTPPCPPADRPESEGPTLVTRLSPRLADAGTPLPTSRFVAPRSVRVACLCLDGTAV
ncbi:hypothetical protein ACIBUR_29130 [Streptomyces anulatus]